MRYEYLQPASFAVDIRWQPHNDITLPQYIPVRDPLISLEGADWLAMPSPALRRYRVSTLGSLFHRTDGLHGALSDEEIAAVLRSEPNLERAAESLVASAVQRDGKDNVTIALARHTHMP